MAKKNRKGTATVSCVPNTSITTDFNGKRVTFKKGNRITDPETIIHIRSYANPNDFKIEEK